MSDTPEVVRQEAMTCPGRKWRRLIPCFDGFYGSALQAIADWAPARPLDNLDVGAGTGLFAAMVAERHPVGWLCLLDGSAAILEQARARFSDAVAVDIGSAI